MKSEEKTLFIWLLEYGEAFNNRKVSCHDMLNHAVQTQFINSRSESKAAVLRNLFYECFEFETSYKSNAIRAAGRNEDAYDQHPTNLKAEYYFRLLEFRELQLARESALKANTNAVRALIFSITAMLVSAALAIGTSWWQMSNPIDINAEQIKQLQQSIMSIKSPEPKKPKEQ